MFNKYPYTDFHELNLDWILSTIRSMRKEMSEFEALNTITFQGAWNITTQYPQWSVVDYNGMGYLSLQPVPAGIDISNTDYWKMILDYHILIQDVESRLDALESAVSDIEDSLDTINYYKGRSILILGDSISDEQMTNFMPNWVVHFREKVEKCGGTVTNFSKSGRTISAVDPSNNLISELSNIPAGSYTDVILFMGINDWHLGATVAQMDAARVSFFTWLDTTYPTALLHIVTPLKSNNNITSPSPQIPLDFYRFMLNKYWVTVRNANIVDAFAEAPLFNGDNSLSRARWTYANDGIHPNTNYSPILATYIFHNIPIFHSSINSIVVSSVGITNFFGTKPLNIYFKSDGEVTLYMDLGASYTPGSTVEILGSLPDWCRPFAQESGIIYGQGTRNIMYVVTHQADGRIFMLYPDTNNIPALLNVRYNVYKEFYNDNGILI